MNLDEFNKLVESGEKYLVKIGAEWCGPCKAYDKILDTICTSDSSLSDRVFRYDIDDSMELVSHFGVNSIPVTFYIGDGKYEQKLGIQREGEIVSWFN